MYRNFTIRAHLYQATALYIHTHTHMYIYTYIYMYRNFTIRAHLYQATALPAKNSTGIANAFAELKFLNWPTQVRTMCVCVCVCVCNIHIHTHACIGDAFAQFIRTILAYSSPKLIHTSIHTYTRLSGCVHNTCMCAQIFCSTRPLCM